MSDKSKFFGSTLIIAGTALGAGMLALPLVGAGAGFAFSFLVLIFTWAVMVCSALLILEVNLAFKIYENNFCSMAAATLGPVAKVITWLLSLGLLYSLTAAYIAGDGSLLFAASKSIFSFKIPEWVFAVLFTVVLGGAVFWSTAVVDHLNRGLLSIKGVLLIIALSVLLPHISFAYLHRQMGAAKYMFAAAPIFLCSLAFHHVIPSITNYVGPKPRTLKWIIIFGATIPVVIYIFWLLATLGIVPLNGGNSFSELAKNNGSVGEFVVILTALTKSKLVSTFINGFTNIAMTTSFLGVTLGLFDFLADAFKRQNHRVGRLQTALLTFIPPLIFAVIYPRGFVVALGYAAIFVALLQIILPALMVLKIRKNGQLNSTFRMIGGKWLPIVILVVGVSLIIIEIAK